MTGFIFYCLHYAINNGILIMRNNIHGYTPYQIDDSIWVVDVSTRTISNGICTGTHGTFPNITSYDVLLTTGSTINVLAANVFALQSYAEIFLQRSVTPTPTITASSTPPVTGTPFPTVTPSMTVSNKYQLLGNNLMWPMSTTQVGGTVTADHGTFTFTSTGNTETYFEGTVPTVHANTDYSLYLNYIALSGRYAVISIYYDNTELFGDAQINPSRSNNELLNVLVFDTGIVDCVINSGAAESLKIRVELFEDSQFKTPLAINKQFRVSQLSLKSVGAHEVLTSPTPTGTISVSQTQVLFSPTPTPTVTPSKSGSVVQPTPTPTATRTVTGTLAASSTPSVTHSPSPTPTLTTTPSVTHSAAVTVTPTHTATVSGTPAVTVTPSVTRSVAVSGTPPVTVTPTATATVTPTISGTPAVTVSPNVSVSPTPTVTASPTLTITPTHTGTPAVTVTISVTPNPTLTPAVTGTPAATVTPTVSPTISITPSVTLTPTVTVTQTPAI
jgi:hypothetical protein